MIERRQSERKQVAALVYLCVTGQRFRRCKASDLSAGGIFIEMEPFALRRGRKVQLVFVLATGATIKLHRLPAVVARVTRAGAGMLLHSKLPRRRAGVLPQYPSLS
ncbi:MAG: PilZ domain-containing protein [Gammaproteobacteria bacterium]